ncbi:MAG: histidine phosphatase family protein [Promethearchaeota archaeon]
MDCEEIWKKVGWAAQAHQLIKGLQKFPEESKIIIILRHSHRDKMKPNEIHRNMKLTSQGHEIAKKFGERLPINRPIRLFHSIVERCQETANDIFAGFEKIGGIGELKGVYTPLYNIHIIPELFLNELKKYTLLEITYRWIAGLYSSDQLTPPEIYSRNAAECIWNQVESAPHKCIDIHITHEILIMGMRFNWFGLPPDDKWVNFLGGFAFTFLDNYILLFDIDRLITVEIPYWWNNHR